MVDAHDPHSQLSEARRPPRIDLVSGLSEAEADELERMAESLRLERGERLYNLGDAAERIFMVRSGTVRLFRSSEGGKEVNLALLGSGELFGEQILGGESHREDSAEALGDATVWAFGARELDSFVRQRPAMAMRIIRMVGNRLQRVETKIRDILFHDVRTRLARTLADLAQDFGESCPEGRRIRCRLTQTDLAQLIGSTRETTSSIFNEFRRDGLVDSDAEGILVLGLEDLRRYPGDGD